MRILLILALLHPGAPHKEAPIAHCKRQLTSGIYSWTAGGKECAQMHAVPNGWFAKIDRLPAGPPITAQQRADGTTAANEATFANQAQAEAKIEEFCQSDDKTWGSK